MNPALEMKRFGEPETVLRFASTLQQVKVGLLELNRTLDAQVSSVVPSSWQGEASAAFKEDWDARSRAISQAADRAGRLGMAMQTLGSELQQALAKFQALEQAAASAGSWFVDVFTVQPATNQAAWWLQAEGIAAWQWAETARLGASRELDWMGSGVVNEFFQLLTRTWQGLQYGVYHFTEHPWQSTRTTLEAVAKATYEGSEDQFHADPEGFAEVFRRAEERGRQLSDAERRMMLMDLGMTVAPLVGPAGRLLKGAEVAAGETAAGTTIREAVDTNGFRPSPSQLKTLDITSEQMKWWASEKAPLGMTPDQYTRMKSSLFDSLGKDGISADQVDARLHGSSANFYSSDAKPWQSPAQLANDEVAQKLAKDFAGDSPPPAHQMFDSRYRLGQAGPYPEKDILKYSSDYDLNFSSDQMIQKAQAQWDARAAAGNPYPGEMLTERRYLNNEHGLVSDTFPELSRWQEQWTRETGRDVSFAVFDSTGPANTTGRGTGVSVHFQETDWMIKP